MNVNFKAAKYINGNLEEIIEEAGKTHSELYLGVIKAPFKEQACLVTLRDNKIVQRPCVVDVIPRWDDGDKSTTVFYFMEEGQAESISTLADQFTRLGRLENSFSFPFANGEVQAVECNKDTYNAIIGLKQKYPTSTLENAIKSEKQADEIAKLKEQLLQQQKPKDDDIVQKQYGTPVIIEELSMENGEYKIGRKFDTKEQYVGTIKTEGNYYLVTEREGNFIIKPCVIDSHMYSTPSGNITTADYYFCSEGDGKDIASKINDKSFSSKMVVFDQPGDVVHAYACDSEKTLGSIRSFLGNNPTKNIVATKSKSTNSMSAVSNGLGPIL